MAIAPEIVAKPFYVSTNQRVEFRVTSDEIRKTPTDVTGQEVALFVTDLSGVTYRYVGTNDPGTGGTGFWDLLGLNHTTVGNATAQVQIDEIPKGDFSLEFRAKKSAS